MDYDAIVTRLYEAQVKGREVDKITIDTPSLTVDDGYAIQARVAALREEAGDRPVGWKMGLTSEAKQRSVGVHEPIYGRLTEQMELVTNHLSMTGLIHPRLEPEIAFILKKPLGGPRVTVRDVWAATECVMPAVEIIDSRYRNFSFTLADVVADNASSSRFYLAEQAFSPYDRLWNAIGVTLSHNGQLAQNGSTAAVLGHPVRSVLGLCHMLAAQDLVLEAGSIVLTGGITEAVSLAVGDVVRVQYDGLGEITLATHE